MLALTGKSIKDTKGKANNLSTTFTNHINTQEDIVHIHTSAVRLQIHVWPWFGLILLLQM